MSKKTGDGSLLEHYVNPDGTVTLYHFAEHGSPDKITTDPSRFGKNKWSQAERKAEGTPKTFFYVDLAHKEGFFGGRPLYTRDYPAKHIYDATGDPEGHTRSAYSIHDLVTKLREAGYHGMFYSGVFPTVAAWQPIEMTKTEEPARLARMQAPAGGAVVNNTFHRGGQFLGRGLRRIREVVERLARRKGPLDAALPGSAQPPADVVKPFTIGELKQLEDDHGIAKTKRLSNRVKPDDEALGDASTFRAAKQHVAPFLNELTKKRLVGHKLRAKLSDPSVSDAAKLAYLTTHLATEAREFTDATTANGAPEWYGEHVDDMEHALNHIFGFKPYSAHSTLTKGMMAASSGSQNPRTNALSLYRMLDAGRKRNPDNPILGTPAYDEDTLRAWLAHAAHPRGEDGRVHDSLARPGHTEVDETHPPYVQAQWYAQHVLPRREQLNGPGDNNAGYRGRPAVIVDRPGHPDHGKLVEYNVGDDVRLTPEGGALYQRHRKDKRAGRSKSYLRRVLLPDPDRNGMLRPKGWGTRGEQIENGVGRLQKLVADLGVEKARDWLLTPHDDEEFKKRFDYEPDRSQIGTDEKLPGMFILGPKFGAFALNLHGNHPDPKTASGHAKWLTADMWWTRTWNRFMGTMFEKKMNKQTGKMGDELVGAPRGTRERKDMAEAAANAAKEAGLRNVAELQAVMWYYEQRMWRQLGVRQAKSYSFRHGSAAMLHEDAKRYPNKYTPEQHAAIRASAAAPDDDALAKAAVDSIKGTK